MATKIEKSVDAKPIDEREARWKAHVDAYAKKNPVKFAAKNARKEFDSIPLSFK